MFLGNLLPGITKFLKLFSICPKIYREVTIFLLLRLVTWQFVLTMGPSTKRTIQSIYLFMSEAAIPLACSFIGLLSRAEIVFLIIITI